MTTRILSSIFFVAFLGSTALVSPAQAAGTGAAYGARDPASCEPFRAETAPDPATAASLIRCRIEHEGGNELWLMKDVTVEIGRGRDYNPANDTSISDADANYPVHPLRGAFIWSICNRRDSILLSGQDLDRNCRETDVPKATGACWRTTFGDWSCTLGGAPAGEPRPGMPPLK